MGHLQEFYVKVQLLVDVVGLDGTKGTATYTATGSGRSNTKTLLKNARTLADQLTDDLFTAVITKQDAKSITCTSFQMFTSCDPSPVPGICTCFTTTYYPDGTSNTVITNTECS